MSTQPNVVPINAATPQAQISAPPALTVGSAKTPAATQLNPPPRQDHSVSDEAFRALDRMREALTAQTTGGLSPASLALAFMDWSIHLASAPGKCTELALKAGRKAGRLGAHIRGRRSSPADEHPCIEPLAG